MRSNLSVLLTLWLWLIPTFCAANDGFGGLSATGLQFGKSDSVRMVREDLLLSPQKVQVRSLFRNDGPETVAGEVIFPLPPISLAELSYAGFSLGEDALRADNPVHFTARINGMPIPVRTDRIAVIEPPFDQRHSAAGRYDTPGREVTDLLREHDLPLSLDIEAVTAQLAALPGSARQRLLAAGLIELNQGAPPTPQWSIILRYHWPQRFPPGRDMVIEHSYDPAPPGGIFIWPARDADLAAYQQELVRDYCIDAATRKGIVKRLHPPGRGEMAGTGMALYLDYVLTTANTWKGPIGTFHLTIDKGKPDSILSLCIDGLRKTGPTRFELETTNFTPTRDLRLLFVSPLGQ
jgi:hypothetical protein